METKSEEMGGFEKKNNKSIWIMCRERSHLICIICPWCKLRVLIPKNYIFAFSESILGWKHCLFSLSTGHDLKVQSTTGCSPRLNYQHLIVTRRHLIPVSGDPLLSYGLHRHQAHMCFTDIRADKTPIHINLKKNF